MFQFFAFTRREWAILSVTSLGVFMSTLDASVVNISLPSITSYYHASLSSAEWVVMVYLLLLSSLLLTYGRLGDMIGHKKVYLSGMIIFTIASLFCSFSPSIYYLIFFRGLQAIGGGMISAVVQAIIAANFEPARRGRAIGLNSMIVSMGLAAGPTIGGILTSLYGWQSIFILNIPIGMAGCIWAWRVLPQQKGLTQKFDLLGAGTLFIGLAAFLLAMSHGQEWGWTSPAILGLLFAGACSIFLFLYAEAHNDQPIVDLALFKNRLFAVANLTAMINYITQYSVVFLMPFYLINALKYEPRMAGLLMTAFPLAMMMTSPFSGILCDWVSSRLLSTLGLGISALAVSLLSFVYLTQSLALVVIALALVGLGTGLFLTPNNKAIMGSVPPSQVGIASGMLAMMRSMGQVLGVAVSGAVFSSRLAVYGSGGYPLALHDTYLVALGIGVAGMIISANRGSS